MLSAACPAAIWWCVGVGVHNKGHWHCFCFCDGSYFLFSSASTTPLWIIARLLCTWPNRNNYSSKFSGAGDGRNILTSRWNASMSKAKVRKLMEVASNTFWKVCVLSLLTIGFGVKGGDWWWAHFEQVPCIYIFGRSRGKIIINVRIKNLSLKSFWSTVSPPSKI